MYQNFITVNNLQIAYYTRNPEQAETIFFIHGNSSSSRVWRKQVESPLLAAYRLITVDLPSHGNSDQLPPYADFSVLALGQIMAIVINELINDKPYIICGSSLGTNIVVEMIVNNCSPKGIVLAGPCIVGERFGMDKMILPGADVSPIFADNVPKELVNKYAKETSFSTEEKDTEIFLEDYYTVTGNFRSSLYDTVANGSYNDEIEILKNKNCTICIVFGKDEKVVNNHYLDEAPINVWHNTIYRIAGASHLVNIDAPEAFNKITAEFAKDIFTKDVA
ncbi:alpha/beta hydrolase [Ginsengibacter hankyongi]|uniref:Alpha/beta hydrolase n=1 Tax=Ginsengibacter hankyongi TaxID=2607284 RepID=A0A5J5IDF5_9BACT|nr:alpha/beta hydrolase [Ginsengibacter hankyongi]KAA9037652.1 alpha/beta hydrolase [Ginsengibacter hankyongi]